MSIQNVTGSAKNDTIAGNASDNVLAGGGSDARTAPFGDTVDYSASPSGPVIVDLGASPTGTATGDGSDKITGFESAAGSNYNDTMTGDGNANTLSGGSATTRSPAPAATTG